MRLTAIVICAALTACGPAMEDLPSITDVDMDDTEAARVEAVAPQDDRDGGGLFAGLFRGPNDQNDTPPADPAVEAVVADVTQTLTANEGSPDAGDPPARGGLLRLFRRAEAPVETATDAGETGVELAALTPDAAGVPNPETDATPAPTPDATDATEPVEEVPARPRGLARLFGGASNDTAASGADTAAGPEGEENIQEVSRGTLLPYGSLAKACDLRRSDLGKEVDRYPARGKGYTLYDTNPSSTALRTHYVTGFKDGCARQFTAALAIFGTSETHEAVRYDRSNRDLPYTDTDTAYETLKARVCRAGRQKPCPDNRRARLDRDTVFISVYERFLGNPRWADMLLHDGRVLAKDMKSR